MIVRDISFKAPTLTQMKKKILTGSYKHLSEGNGKPHPPNVNNGSKEEIHNKTTCQLSLDPTFCNHYMDFKSEMDPDSKVLVIIICAMFIVLFNEYKKRTMTKRWGHT